MSFALNRAVFALDQEKARFALSVAELGCLFVSAATELAAGDNEAAFRKLSEAADVEAALLDDTKVTTQLARDLGVEADWHEFDETHGEEIARVGK